MTQLLNSAAVGALVRATRVAASLTQTQLAERIGASRFWVAAFEKGKSSAELGLALKAIHALGLAITIAPSNESSATTQHGRMTALQPPGQPSRKSDIALASIVAHATRPDAVHSSVTGWPSLPATRRVAEPAHRRPKP